MKLRPWVLTIAAGILTLPHAHAQTGLQPADLVALRAVTSVKIAPGGRLIAYSLRVPRPLWTDDAGPPWTELHMVDRQGNNRAFITGEVNVSAIAWTPSGDGVTFLAKRSGDKHKALYFIRHDGGEARKILEHGADIEEYAWHPTGTRLAFIAKTPEDSDAKDATKHGYDAVVYEEDWRSNRLWLVPGLSPAASTPRDTTNLNPVELDGAVSSPLWSADGALLAVNIAPTPSVDDSFMRTRVHILDGTAYTVLHEVPTEGKIAGGAWSPDSTQFALITGIDEHDPSPGRIAVTPARGGETRFLLGDFSGDATAIGWMDKGVLAFLADQGVWTTFNTMGAFGSQINPILPRGQWSFSAMSLSRDGRAAAFIGDSPEHPAEVFYMEHNGKPRRMTNSNPALGNVRLAEQELIRYTARDGLEIEGILIRPWTPKPANGYPLILMVHGGPESHHRNGWLSYYGNPGQVAAARGFAVFYTNYRGSTGRGVEFSKISQNDPAGAEFDDLVDAIDHLAAQGIADKSKVGITGASYGGYASAWAATKLTEHFAAAVMHVGISDTTLSFALGDIPEELTKVHFLEYPWENPGLFRERSPLTHFQQARTPILILHGKDDTRVHPAHSIALYRMLKSYGETPVRLVLYPGEGHGNRKSSAQLDYQLRLLRWMEHYLTGPGGDPPPHDLDLAPYTDKQN